MGARLRGRAVSARRRLECALVACLCAGLGACGGTTGRENIAMTSPGAPEAGVAVDATVAGDAAAGVPETAADAGATDAIPYADVITYVDVAGYRLPEAGPDGAGDGGTDAAPSGPPRPSTTDGILALIVDGAVMPSDGAPLPLVLPDGAISDAGSDCFQCAAMNQCDDLNGGANNDCEDFGDATVPANAQGGGGGLSARELCLDTFWCIATNGCVHAGSPQACLCGDSGYARCTSAFEPGVLQNGPCWRQEIEGLETNAPARFDGIFTTPTLPAGRANNMIVCLSGSGCSSCF